MMLLAQYETRLLDEYRCRDSEPFIPVRVLEALNRHVTHGSVTGDFTQAVLHNDLRLAVMLADKNSLAALQSIVMYLHNNVPGACWGSAENIEAWRKEREAETEKASL